MIVGFTGRRTTPTREQLEWLNDRLRELQPAEFHHGACVGADAIAHRIAETRLIPTHVHPPHDTGKVDGYCVEHSSVCYPPLPYLARNHAIVDVSDRLLALPDGPERLRSGTWATIRYARAQGVPVDLYLPETS